MSEQPFQLESPDADTLCRELPADAHWPQVLAEMIEVLRATFRRNGHSDDTSIALAEQGVIAIAQHMGGQHTYLPHGDRLVRAARNRRIFLELRGNNHDALMARYGIKTRRRLEQIIAEQSALHVRRVQPDLFEAGGE